MFNGHLVWWPFFPFVLSLTLFDASSIFSIFLRKIEPKKVHFIELKTKEQKSNLFAMFMYPSFYFLSTTKRRNWIDAETEMLKCLANTKSIRWIAKKSADDKQPLMCPLMKGRCVQKWEHCGEVWLWVYFLFLQILEHQPLIWKQLQDFSRCYRAAHKYYFIKLNKNILCTFYVPSKYYRFNSLRSKKFFDQFSQKF